MTKRQLKWLSSFVGTVLVAVVVALANKVSSTTIDPSPAVVPVVVATTTKQIPPLVADSSVGTTDGSSTNALVIRAVDGDTLAVRFDGEKDEAKVRLLGINTPETVDPRKAVECFGKEASKHMHDLVDGKRVRLDEDPQADEHDKYDRRLRNLYLADGTDVGAAMVHDGYAYAYLSFPLNAQRKQELKKLQEDAKLSGRGLWSPTTCNGAK